MIALLLAAGLSRRMKRRKLLMPFRDGVIIDSVLRSILASGFERTIVVASGDVASHIERLYAHADGISTVLNEHPERGQASSLILGVEAAGEALWADRRPKQPADSPAFCVMLGDLPLVTSEEMLKYREIFERMDARYTALVPQRDGRIGHPIFFSHIWMERLVHARDDAGGRFIVARFPDEVLSVSGEDSFFTDIDTPLDYEKITKYPE